MISHFVRTSALFAITKFTDLLIADRRGNRVLVGICVLNIFLYLFAKVYYVWRNKQRDRIWNSMTVEEKLNYLETTTDEGSKRLDFRFAH